MGAVEELVRHRRTGLLFRAGDADELSDAVRWMSTEPAAWTEMRREARSEYLRKYSGGVNAERLEAIYEAAIGAARGMRRPQRGNRQHGD
jgi:glycosyltransferase involved in cell wall biosynthesis